jgi:hypothetical protein
LKIFLKRAVDSDSDGWVPAEDWETAKKELKSVHDLWVESMKETGASEDRMGKLWPFNEI